MTPNVSRRAVLKGAAAWGGALILPISGPGPVTAATTEPTTHSFLSVGPDGRVTVQFFQAEMGQGVYTLFGKVVAEELDVPLSQLDVVPAPVREEYRNRFLSIQGTGFSSSARLFVPTLRRAAAQAKAMLLAAAAQTWQTGPEGLTAHDGQVTDPASGRSIGYGDLASLAAQMPRPASPALKPTSDWRILGKPSPRLDAAAKADGSATYGIDVKVPGMVHAAIRHAPGFGSRVTSFEEPSSPGVIATVNLGDAVAVVADHWWQAKRAAEDLSVTFAPSPHEGLDDREVMTALRAALNGRVAPARADGAVSQHLREAGTVVEADYHVPLLAHLTMEPMNCTARISDDGVDVWVGTQFQELARTAAAQAAGVPSERVRIHNQFLGGGFGRRCETDFVVQAVTLAKTVQRPVKLIWSREEDVQHDFYRPISAARLTAGLDPQGRIVAWRNTVVGPSILSRMFPQRVQNNIDPTSLQGAIDLPYRTGSLEVNYALVDSAIPFGWWRSVGHSSNGFFIESFIDEIAAAAGQDPLEFRRAHVAHDTRALAVLDRVAALSDWADRHASGRHLGLAFGHGYGSYAAAVAEVAMVNGSPSVTRIFAVADCGVILDPASFEAQLQGGLIFGLSAAMWGRIDVRQGKVEQSNFHDCRVVTLSDVPEIIVETVASSESIGGVGEVMTPLVAPAAANALFAATGQRKRSLPLVEDS